MYIFMYAYKYIYICFYIHTQSLYLESHPPLGGCRELRDAYGWNHTLCVCLAVIVAPGLIWLQRCYLWWLY